MRSNLEPLVPQSSLYTDISTIQNLLKQLQRFVTL